MDKVNLGRIEVIYRPDAADQSSQVSSGSVHKIWPQPISPSEVESRVGFNILRPGMHPWPGMQLVGVNAWVDPESDVSGIVSKYKADSAQWMAIRQTSIGRASRSSVPYVLSEVKVGGQPAALFRIIVPASAHPGGQLTIVHLWWEYQDFFMNLESPQLSEQDLIQVAQSLS